ncbi:MAG: hypothetical protein R2828_03580 [Saprospiraceae bacterium]
MKNTIFCLVCISLFFVACQKADVSTDFPQHAVNLSDLKAGQVTYKDGIYWRNKSSFLDFCTLREK